MKANLVRFIQSRYLIIFISVIVLDQVTKILATTITEPIVIIPNFFALIYSRNTGAFSGIFQGLDNSLLYLAIISGVVGVGLFYVYLRSWTSHSWMYHTGIILFLSGTWGNFIDRAFYQEGVIDFLSFDFGLFIFPTFNVADSALTIGVIILIAMSIFETSGKHGKK
jgi:signal peptidase II